MECAKLPIIRRFSCGADYQIVLIKDYPESNVFDVTDIEKKLAEQIKQAIFSASCRDIDACVKQIANNSLGACVARATQEALAENNVVVRWVPETADSAGSFLVMTEKMGAAFSVQALVEPEGMSVTVNELAIKRGDLNNMFVTKPIPAWEALQAMIGELD